MKILQLDVRKIEYKPIEPELKTHESSDKKSVVLENALVLLTSIESGDTEAFASRALKDSFDFAEKNKIKTILLYPFAHLSTNLEEPQRAMNLFQYMVKEAGKSKLNVASAPFGWNKSLMIEIKGHPLAEMSRSYGKEVKEVAAAKKHERKIDTSIVRKSEFSGLPETDHRIIGERLNLFSFQEVSPGMVYWHNKGYIIFKELTKYIREKLDEYGYEEVATPIMANTALWHISGHIDHFRENMFIFDSNDQEIGLKPMNCPFAMLIFKSRARSYRDLPMRLADFDKLYRNEISGALSGLFRVRELTQDDAHIFVSENQIENEFAFLLNFVNDMYSLFGVTYKAKLSTMPDSHLGDEATWDKAQSVLESVLKKSKVKYEIKEKEGAFYGPKIDIDVKDSMGREWQCATIQLDYQLPQRFGLKYTGEDGKEHVPIVIHRVIYGSLERFIGIIIEHYKGKFPTWLSPVQVRVITISDTANGYAEKVYKAVKKEKIRVELDISDKTLDYKIRDAQNQKIPYMIILGKKEVEGKKISIRGRSGKQKLGVSEEEFIESLKKEILERKSEQMF